MHEKDIGNPRFCIHLDTKTRIDLKGNQGFPYDPILLLLCGEARLAGFHTSRS
jgi:hypothetical protein